ncbi:MAG: CTP synthase, partial [Pseudomonadota bacterium]
MCSAIAKKYANTKFIFVTGGVFSSLGKGLTAASLAVLLKQQGIEHNGKPFKVRLQKSDPYLNVDPGTMSPFQHGEVYVTDDGGETDLDLGHYERFTGDNSSAANSISAGRIYQQLLEKERRGEYLGKTVQVIPHVTNLIKQFILNGAEKYDFCITEIGGTVGDIEGLPFFETIRQLGNELPRDQVLFLHVTFVPYVAAAKELKTKPTQHSVKELRAIGIQPNIIMCRSEKEISTADINKIALFCNVKEQNVIPAPDVKCTYEVPLVYHQNGLDAQVLSHFGITYKQPNLQVWQQIINNYNNRQGKIKIAVVGKYNRVKDAYKSLIEAFEHAGIHHRVKVQLEWVNARTLTDEETVANKLSQVHGIMVPGGFGEEGVAGKILAINYAREHKV